MYDALKERWELGSPVIRDLSRAQPPGLFRGAPALEPRHCPPDCAECRDACPTNAIALNPLCIDLGKCIFCPACVEVCPTDAIQFRPDIRMGSRSRDGLILGTPAGFEEAAGQRRAPEKIRRLFGTSLKLRSVSSGGCNGCELELNALSNVNFDMGRFGIEFVASPRHADGVVITGPLPKAMAGALYATFEAIPSPKIIIAVGACAISGGIFQDSPVLDREFFSRFRVDLYIPGCPPHPLTFLSAVLEWLGR